MTTATYRTRFRGTPWIMDDTPENRAEFPEETAEQSAAYERSKIRTR